MARCHREQRARLQKTSLRSSADTTTATRTTAAAAAASAAKYCSFYVCIFFFPFRHSSPLYSLLFRLHRVLPCRRWHRPLFPAALRPVPPKTRIPQGRRRKPRRRRFRRGEKTARSAIYYSASDKKKICMYMHTTDKDRAAKTVRGRLMFRLLYSRENQ